MQEIIKTILNGLAAVVVLISLRVVYDAIETLYKDRSGSMDILILFLALISVGLWSIALNYMIDLPLWLRIWHIGSLLALMHGTYTLITTNRKE